MTIKTNPPVDAFAHINTEEKIRIFDNGMNVRGKQKLIVMGSEEIIGSLNQWARHTGANCTLGKVVIDHKPGKPDSGQPGDSAPVAAGMGPYAA